MRIAHVMTYACSKGGGVSSVVEKLSDAQQRAGINVKVFAVLTQEWEQFGLADWKGAPVNICAPAGPAVLGYSPEMYDRILKWQPDIVHLHGLWTYTSRSVLQWHRKTGLPYLISAHGMLSPVALSFSQTKKRIASLLFQDATLNYAAAYHATSEVEALQIRQYGLNQPVFTIPNGADYCSVPPKNRSSSSKQLLYLGRIHPIKGLDHLVEAWSKLECHFQQWSLVIAGPSEANEANRLEKSILARGLSRATILGPIYGEAKLLTMAKADIFVLPTLSENFALTVAESLMLETPVICSKGAPWRRLDQKGCGRWVDIGSEPLRKALVEMMLLNNDERAEMGIRGRKWMLAEYSWDSVAAACLSAYQKIASQAGA